MTNFKLNTQERKELEDIFDGLLLFCQIHKIPMFCSVAVQNNAEGTEYKNITYGTSSHVISLTDDKIRKHILVSNGFEPVPARESITLDMEDFVYDEG